MTAHFFLFFLFNLFANYGLDLNQCKIYLNKLNGQVDNQGIVNQNNNLNISLQAYYRGYQDDIQLAIEYFDVDYFTNMTYFGLVKEDGKNLNDTCLSLKIYQYENEEKIKGKELSNVQIYSSCQYETKRRFYNFILKKEQLSIKLIRTTNQISFSITGYFGIAFCFIGTNIIASFFPLNIEISDRKNIHFAYEEFEFYQNYQCFENNTSTIQFCNDLKCSSFLKNPSFSLNQNFIILQTLNSEEYYVNEIEIRYEGNGLNKRATIKELDLSIKGQAKVKLSVEIAWRFVNIHITAFCNINGQKQMCGQYYYIALFQPLSLSLQQQCSPRARALCEITQSNSIQWCSDYSCTSFTTPDLHFNDQFVLLLPVTISLFQGYQLADTEIWFIGKGLNKQANIIQIDNSFNGQVKVLLKAEIVWRSVIIKVTLILSTTQAAEKQSTSKKVTETTNEICIKPENSDSCPTCEEECLINKFANSECASCANFGSIIFQGLLIGILVVIS